MKAKKVNLRTSILVSMLGILVAGVLFTGCSKDKDTPDPSSPRKVVFKAQTSADASISNAAYGYDSEITYATGLSGTTWTSPEITVPGNALSVYANMGGLGSSAASTVKIQIFVDGTLKKEATATGTQLVASVQYQF